MNPRMRKKLLKRIKSIDKDMKKDKLKTITSENLREHMEELREKRKHFPHNLLSWARCMKRKVADSFYYYKCYFFHPYNKIKIRTLPPTWMDRDIVLLHACFTIFCSVIEKEELLERTGFDHSEEIADLEKEKWEDEEHRKETIEGLKERHKKDQGYEKELKYLYKWWKVSRPKREKKLNDPSKWFNLGLDEKAYEEDTDHLVRLMKIRGGLWT